MKKLEIGRGTVLTYNQKETRQAGGMTVNVLPVWKWLLGETTYG